MILVDTDVMVDIMRQHPPAVAWLASIEAEVIGIPGLVVMELLQGCRNRDEQQRLLGVLGPFQRYWPSQVDCARALDDLGSFYLSHGLGVLDALIAHTAVGLTVELATFNTSHYRVVPNLRTVQPYSRG